MRRIFAITVTCGVIVLGFLCYGLLNAADSLDKARQEQSLDRKRTELLRHMLTRTTAPMNRDDFRQFIKDFSNGHIVKESADQIEVDSIVFVLKDGRVIDVKEME